MCDGTRHPTPHPPLLVFTHFFPVNVGDPAPMVSQFSFRRSSSCDGASPQRAGRFHVWSIRKKSRLELERLLLSVQRAIETFLMLLVVRVRSSFSYSLLILTLPRPFHLYFLIHMSNPPGGAGRGGGHFLFFCFPFISLRHSCSPSFLSLTPATPLNLRS